MHRFWNAPTLARSSWLPLTLLVFAACSSDSDSGYLPLLSEVEPNDAFGQALPLGVGQPALGDVVTAGDVDFWRVPLAAGQVIRIEVFATRLDQAAWDAAGNNPYMTIFDTDGTTRLLEHDLGGDITSGWSWGEHDLDFPAFEAPATGTYYVSVTQGDGAVAGGSYTFTVQNLEVGVAQNEVETIGMPGTNDTFGTAESITPGVVKGFHVDDESDFYSFTTTGPTIVRLTLTAHRIGLNGGDDDYFDPEMELFDTDGTTLLNSVDDAYFYDPSIHYWIDTPGTYFVNVQECCGNGDAVYLLELEMEDVSVTMTETEANDTSGTANPFAYGDVIEANGSSADTDFFSFSGTNGDLVRVEYFDSYNFETSTGSMSLTFFDTDGVTPLTNSQGSDPQLGSTILQSTGTFFLRFTSGGAATPYAFRVNRERGTLAETEPNDTVGTEDALDANGFASGAIGVAMDVDMFSFTADTNRPTTISVRASTSGLNSDGFFNLSGLGSSMQPKISVLDENSMVLATSDTQFTTISTEGIVTGDASCSLTFIAPTSGTYYVQVEDTNGTSSASHYYLLEVR